MDEEEESIHLPFDFIAALLYIAEDAQRHLKAALNGNPAELLRTLAINLNEAEWKFISQGWVDQYDERLGLVDQYSLMGQSLDDHRHRPWSVALKGNNIYLTRIVPVDPELTAIAGISRGTRNGKSDDGKTQGSAG